VTLICVIMQNEKNRSCNFFKWVEPIICMCGDRVMPMLMELQNELKSEWAMEVFKCKIELAECNTPIKVTFYLGDPLSFECLT
jgi:hypothetical protein